MQDCNGGRGNGSIGIIGRAGWSLGNLRREEGASWVGAEGQNCWVWERVRKCWVGPEDGGKCWLGVRGETCLVRVGRGKCWFIVGRQTFWVVVIVGECWADGGGGKWFFEVLVVGGKCRVRVGRGNFFDIVGDWRCSVEVVDKSWLRGATWVGGIWKGGRTCGGGGEGGKCLVWGVGGKFGVRVEDGICWVGVVGASWIRGASWVGGIWVGEGKCGVKVGNVKCLVGVGGGTWFFEVGGGKWLVGVVVAI